MHSHYFYIECICQLQITNRYVQLATKVNFLIKQMLTLLNKTKMHSQAFHVNNKKPDYVV